MERTIQKLNHTDLDIGPYNRKIPYNYYHNVLDLFFEMLFEIDICSMNQI